MSVCELDSSHVYTSIHSERNVVFHHISRGRVLCLDTLKIIPCARRKPKIINAFFRLCNISFGVGRERNISGSTVLNVIFFLNGWEFKEKLLKLCI